LTVKKNSKFVKAFTERQFLRRKKILSVARDLIAAKGYEGVTMRELARRSSVTPKTLYDQFGSKDKLLLVAIEERFRHTYDAIDSESVEKGIDKLFFVIEAVCEISEQNINYARAIWTLNIISSENLELFVGIRKATYFNALRQIRDEGDILPWVNLEIMLDAMYRVVSGLYSSWFSGASGTVGLEFGELRGMLKLHACHVLVAYTGGKTQEKALAIIKASQTD